LWASGSLRIPERIGPMSTKSGQRVSYRSMSVLALVVGVICIALQFIPGWELISFMLSVAVLGGLIGAGNSYEEQDRQQLGRSYKTAFEWLLLVMMAVYALIEFAKWLSIAEGSVMLLDGHWPGFVLALMCVLMGLAGFQRRSSESST
jgi:hypothetical protein